MVSFGEPEAWAQEEFQVYAKRCPSLGGQLEELRLKPSRHQELPKRLEEERDLFRRRCPEAEALVVLSEEGKNLSTKELAQWMGNAGSRITFLIGSAHGLHPDLKTQGKLLLSLSRLTFTHEHARLLLSEQIYRCLAVLKGHPYHHV